MDNCVMLVSMCGTVNLFIAPAPPPRRKYLQLFTGDLEATGQSNNVDNLR